MIKFLSFLLAILLTPLFGAMADVACPSGYTQVIEDVVYISSGNSCPNGDTKLGGEYGEDSILNCIGAQSDAVPICTYFAESCQPGMSFDGMSHQSCPSGSYCDGSGTATPGVAGCSSPCPENSHSASGATSCTCNDGYYMVDGACEICPAGYACSGGEINKCNKGTYADVKQSVCTSCPPYVDLFNGNALINSEGGFISDFRDIDGDGVYTSVDECGVTYFVDDDYGMGYAFCTYNASNKIYDKNCIGYPIGCAAGRYADTENAEYVAESYYPVIKISGDNLNEYVSHLCSSVGENYWSPAPFEDYSNLLDTLKRTPCPANSSTKGATTATYCTCNDGYTVTGTIGGNIQTTTDACRPIPEFSIITTSMDAGTEFGFNISAAGEYTIDWGDGTVESIVKTDTNDTTYSHIYTSGGVHTIGIGGDATEYNDTDHTPVISFENNTNVDKLVGSLGTIFKKTVPFMFYGTFHKCYSLTEVPKNLFDGISGSATGMFAYTFSNCKSLKEIPENLFGGISGSASEMFMYTFAACTDLTIIPENLFNGITGTANNMFYATFMGDTSLTEIPNGLFKNITGKPAENAFSGTFHSCSNLTGYVPTDMFEKMDSDGYVAGPMYGIFGDTKLETQCPAGSHQYITGFEADWDGRVACTPCPSTHPNSVAGATYESQCYTTCTKQCTQQTCPKNATCTHGTTTTTGKEYVGTACDAEQTACEITVTCNSGYSLTDGECVSDDFDAEFTITTTNIPANESFWFYISAAGTYKVNWGDGNIEKIEKTNTTNEQISHIYATSGTYEIKLAGDAIRYNSDSYNNVAAIRFSYDDTDVIGNPYLKTISGSLGKIFPTLSSSTNGKLQPSFRRLFTNCEKLTGAIPADLFTGVYGTPLGRMFMAAFMNTKITEQLPSDLFSGMDGQISENLFRETFSGCTELTGTIPADLFGNLSGDLQARTFYHTFYGCEKLTGYVPKTLFAKFSRSNESNQMTDVFYNTGLATYCPANEYVYDTGFNDLFSSRVACTPCPDIYPNSDTGATFESQCYATCTKQCTQQTCPENSVNCTHGNEISSGRQYYGSSCDATEIVCDIDFSCSVGYDKLSFADTLVRNMDAIYDSAEYDDYCQLDNTGNSCDTLSAGQYMWYFDTSYGSPISSGQVQTTCTDDMGNDADPQSRINYNADFDIQSSGANCWERVLYLNDSPVSSSWIYNKTYDSAEDCAAYCGFSKPMSVGYALAVATNANLCAPHEYTVTYDCNGGTGNATDTATYKTTFTPRKDVCERNGYKFIGWTLNDASVSDSFVWDYTNDQILIAAWEQMSAECKPGEYLPANATECKPCEENNYCPGGTYNIGTTDIGMNPCHDGSMSNSGATHITQCYINKPCGKYTDITTVCTYNTDTSDFTDCAECSIDTSCPYNQELVNGKCAPCNRDNALDYHKTGNCMVSECEQGFYPYMQQCMPEKIECDAPKANVAYKYWDVANRAYGPCIITECIDDEYHIEANACVPNTQSCDVEHGIGEQEWDFEQNKWGTCVATQCDSGYTTDQSLTNDTLNGQCGRCSNMYVDDELAVSTYISECEIASCMYQGEKYILENNECVLICDERSDETGSRYWNGKKCVHECAEGYSIWE